MSVRLLRVAAGLSVLLLAGALGLAWSHHRTVQRSEGYDRLLRTWLAQELRLNAELLRARAGVVGHYDGIVQTAAARRRCLSELSGLRTSLDGASRRELTQLLEDATSELSRAELMLERWKREHSVLRNSLRFLPRLASELNAVGPRGEGGAQPARYSLALSVVQDALLLQHWPEPGIAERLAGDRSRLEQARADLQARSFVRPVHPRPRSKQRHAAQAVVGDASAERATLASLLTHASIVQERTAQLSGLTRALLAASGAARAQRASDRFATELRAQARVAEADGLRVLLAALCCAGLFGADIILRLRRAAAVLHGEKERARELSELKTRFVAMTSHEFRTPLSVIMSSAELLEAYAERWPISKQAEHFARIRSAALGMTRMLDAVLTIGRSDAGALRCEAQRLEIGSFCAEIVAYMAQADPDCRRIVYHGPDQATAVHADRALLKQVLENLLSNAVKYSPDGSPVLCEVACREGELRVRVVDRGIGISPADQRRLFETFQRGSNVGNIRGFGLGLAVVGRAVQLHGGSVSVHSDLGVGSEFLVRIPCVESAAWTGYS